MKKVIWLRVFKGQKILKNEDGSIDNENQKVSLAYDSLEWTIFLKTIQANYCRVDVYKAFKLQGSDYNEVDLPSGIEKEVEIALKGKPTELSEQQKELAELKAQVAELLKANKPKEEEVVEDSNLEDLKKQYKEKFNKKPHHLWKADKLKEKLS